MNPSFWGTTNLHELLEGTGATHRQSSNTGRLQRSNGSCSSDGLTTMTDDSNSFRTTRDGGEWGFVRSDDLSNTTEDLGGFFNTNNMSEIVDVHQKKKPLSATTNSLSWKTPSPNPMGKRKVKRSMSNLGCTTTAATTLTPLPLQQEKGLPSSRSPTSVMDAAFPLFPQTVPPPPPSDSKIPATTPETWHQNCQSIMLSPSSNCSSPGKHSVGRTVSRKRMMEMRRRSNSLQKPDPSPSSWSSSRSDHRNQQKVAEQQHNNTVSAIEKSPSLSRRRRRVYDSQGRPDFYEQEKLNKSPGSRSLEGIYDLEKSPGSNSTRSLSRRVHHDLIPQLQDIGTEIISPGWIPSRRRPKKTNLQHKSDYQSNKVADPLEKSPSSLSSRKSRLVHNLEEEDHPTSPIFKSPSACSAPSRRRLSGLLNKRLQVDEVLEGDMESLSLSSILKSPSKNQESPREILACSKMTDNAREAETPSSQQLRSSSMKMRRRRQQRKTDVVGTVVDTAFHDSGRSSIRRSNSRSSTVEDRKQQKPYQTTMDPHHQHQDQDQQTVKKLHRPYSSSNTSSSNICSRNNFLTHKQRKLVNLDEFLSHDPNSLTNRNCDGDSNNGKPPCLHQLPTTQQQNNTVMGQQLDGNNKGTTSSSYSPSSTEEQTSSLLAQSEAGTSARTLLRDVGYPENYITTTNTNTTVSTTTSSDEDERRDDPVAMKTFAGGLSSMQEIPRSSIHATRDIMEQVSKRDRYRRRRKLASFQQLLSSNPPSAPPTNDNKERKEDTTTRETKVPYNTNSSHPHMSDTSKYTPRNLSRDTTPSYPIRRHHWDNIYPTSTPATTSNSRISINLGMFLDDTSVHSRTGSIIHIEEEERSVRNAPLRQIDTKTEEIMKPIVVMQNKSFGRTMYTKTSDLSTAPEYQDVIKSTNPRLDKIRKKKRDIEAHVQNKMCLGQTCTFVNSGCIGNGIPSISKPEDDDQKPSQRGVVSTKAPYPCRREVLTGDGLTTRAVRRIEASVDYTLHGSSDDYALPSAVHHLKDGKFRFHPSSEAQTRSCLSHTRKG